MVDVTLEIMLEPPTHDLSYAPEKEAARLRRGDILEIIRSTDFATKDGDGDYRVTEGIGNPRFGYIHITDVPNARARKMRDLLTQPTPETRERELPDPETGLPVVHIISDSYRMKRWRIPRSVIPAALKATLLAEREITVSWNAFRDRIRRKIVTSRLDPALDDESNAVTNADLP